MRYSTTQKSCIKKIAAKIKKDFLSESTGHDWWHIQRVWKMARRIAQEEKTVVNLFVIDAATLLHDVADWKFHQGDQNAGPKKARQILSQFQIDQSTIAHICDIIENISFKGAGVASVMKTLEGKIVQDADRLDALGAIGIARTFAYNGKKGRPIFDPNIKPRMHNGFQDYQTRSTTAINHFYEKLLLLKDRLHTQTARQIAHARHQFMETFLQRFYEETKFLGSSTFRKTSSEKSWP